MTTTRRTAGLACISFLVAGLVVACGQKPAPPAATVAIPTEPATSSSREFGDHVLYFNAIRTDSLTPEIATSYGIVRSANRALVNISMVKKAEGSPGIPVPGIVNVQAVNLNGQLKNLEMRRVTEGPSVYFIGEVGISGTEILVFDISVAPADQPSSYAVQFKREFVAG